MRWIKWEMSPNTWEWRGFRTYYLIINRYTKNCHSYLLKDPTTGKVLMRGKDYISESLILKRAEEIVEPLDKLAYLEQL